VAFYRGLLLRASGPAGYLRRRGLGALVDRAEPWQVGYAPRRFTALADHLGRHGFTRAELRTAGLIRVSRRGRTVDTFRDRIVFPIRDGLGNTVAFIGRVWTGRDAADPEVPKYLNSPDTPIYAKGRRLFGLYEQRDRIAAGWPPVVVEGPVDAVAVWLAHPPSARSGVVAAAPCGVALRREQIEVLLALPGAGSAGLTLAFDADAAGRTAADRAFQLVSAAAPVPVRGAALPSGTDPADLFRQPGGYRRLRAALDRDARPYLHVYLEHQLDRRRDRYPRLLSEVEGRVAFARAVAPLIAAQDPAGAVAAVRQVSAYAGSPELLASLTAAVCEHLEGFGPAGPPR
jgi:DNA primase catalytic core